MKNTKKKGFTIVELVIVIAVIGILSAILIPTFSGLVKNANETKLKAELRNSYMMYAEQVDASKETLYTQDEVYVENDGSYYKSVDGVYDLNAKVSELPAAEEGYEYKTLNLDNGYTVHYLVKTTVTTPDPEPEV